MNARIRAPLLAAALASAGCAGRLPAPPFSPQPTSALVEIPVEPPPARAERIPAQPRPDAVWIDGEWTWRRRRWAWIPGRWVVVPAGVTYSPWCTSRATNGTLYFAPAVWRDAKGGAVSAPPTLVAAGVEAGVVVDPSGEVERTVVGAPPR